MTKIVDIHMASDLSEWTSTVTDSGDLSWASGAGLGGTTGGMQVVLDDSNSIYGEKTFTGITSGLTRLRFYIDPNAVSMPNYNSMNVAQLQNSSQTPIAQVWLAYNPPDLCILAGVFDDNSSWQSSSWWPITDEPHYVEVYIENASSSSANDGRLTLWVDGTQKQQLTGLDYYTSRQADRIRFGAVGGINATLGTIFLDELTINDDGSQIGAVVNAPTLSASQVGSVIRLTWV